MTREIKSVNVRSSFDLVLDCLEGIEMRCDDNRWESVGCQSVGIHYPLKANETTRLSPARCSLDMAQPSCWMTEAMLLFAVKVAGKKSLRTTLLESRAPVRLLPSKKTIWSHSTKSISEEAKWWRPFS